MKYSRKSENEFQYTFKIRPKYAALNSKEDYSLKIKYCLNLKSLAKKCFCGNLIKKFSKKALELNTAIDIHSNITQVLCNLNRIMVGLTKGLNIMVYKNVFVNFRVTYGQEK